MVAVEAHGFDGAWMPELTHDPFPILAIAATRTTTIELGTAITVAFARNPMTMAVLGNDLQTYSSGRFLLGIGSQVKQHITRRFSMPWSAPADRMREYLQAVRAIWRCWETGERLQFSGEFYSHTLMTPYFNPGPNPFGNPALILASVGPRMTRVAGELADGLFVHAFTTERYVREVTLPALREGRVAADKDDSLSGFEVCGSPMIVTGADDEQMANAEAAIRSQIAFYASTPTYRPLLQLHGWADIGEELTAMSKNGQWAKMGQLVNDDMLDAFAIVAKPADVASRIHQRFGDVFTRTSFLAPYGLPDHFWAPITAELQTL
ncbi:TIGR03617 family F420-dependent LLM class oxidoreductase [Mycolicibacterium sp.]|uniref:TIGR03617 family F420-dependent LLM class oxidoreductase n=1 Tax=Mycolicibacterium sp. TaxID=2320850 RepID=UPI003D0D9762